MRTGERGVVHAAIRRGADAVGAAAARGFEDFGRSGFGIEAAVVAVLAGEPKDAGFIEGGGVEVGVGGALGQREDIDLVGVRVDAHYGVEAGIGDPRCAVGADDDAVRGGAAA